MDEPSLSKPKARAMPAWKLREFIDRENIFLDAPYQRDIVWDTKKMSGLIDSMLNNYYIPPLVFAIREVNNKITRVCIDGKQRLTAIYRFMNNEFPYIDTSSGAPIKYFFNRHSSENPNVQAMQRMNKGTALSLDAMERFNSHEFVCVEYADLNEDDEYEIFNRVQLGVAITSAEKLRANNSAITRQINDLTEEFWAIESILETKSTANTFQVITQIIYTIKHGTEEFKANTRNLSLLISDKEMLPRSLIEKTIRVIQKLIEISTNSDCLTAFSLNPSTKKKDFWKRIELLSFSSYLSITDKDRPLLDLSQDCKDMRTYLSLNCEQGLYTGRTQYLICMKWAKERVKEIEETNLRNRLVEQEKTMVSEEEDQLEYNSDGQTPTPVVPPVKRPRRMVPAVARRGRNRK